MRDTCRREGCERNNPSRHPYCSALCRTVDLEMDQAKRACEITGDHRHWIKAIELAEAVTSYHLSDSRLYEAARSVGMSGHQWRLAVKSGV